MPTNEEAIQYIRTLAEQKVLTKEEINDAFESGSGPKKDLVLTKKLGVAEILYYIGGAIVFTGISILLWQNWDILSLGAKILVSLGSGIAAYFVGVIFNREERTESVASAFFLIFAFVTPIGIAVVFDSAGYNVGGYGIQSLISGTMLGVFLLSYALYRKNIFTLFSILWGTWLFYSITSWMVGPTPIFDPSKYHMYRILVMGITYILIGYAFSKNERVSLTGFLYGFGVLGVLGSTYLLGDGKYPLGVLWELVYPGIVFGVLFLSVHIKSKAFLTWGTLFLMAYILKITSEYFSTSLGWPLALVLAGLAMIGAGYMSLSIKKKFLTS